MRQPTKLLTTLLSLACGFGLALSGATANAEGSSTELELSIETVETVELDDEALSCELDDELSSEAANGGFGCEWTCQMEYNICMAGGASNCSYHYNQCVDNCW